MSAKGPWFILSVGPATSETYFTPVLADSTPHQHNLAKMSFCYSVWPHVILINAFKSPFSAERKPWSTEVPSLP